MEKQKTGEVSEKKILRLRWHELRKIQRQSVMIQTQSSSWQTQQFVKKHAIWGKTIQHGGCYIYRSFNEEQIIKSWWTRAEAHAASEAQYLQKTFLSGDAYRRI